MIAVPLGLRRQQFLTKPSALLHSRLPRALAVFGLVLASGNAEAQSSSGSAAQALFEQARSLMAKGRAAEACPKLEESQRLDPAIGTMLNLARCYELVGRLASSWNAYLEAASAAHGAGNAAREREARHRAEALRPKLSSIVIEVAPETQKLAGLQITRDGELVGQPQWGVPIPADAGEHTIVASAPARNEWRTVLMVNTGASVANIVVPELTPAAPSAPVAPAAAPAAAQPAASSDASVEHAPGLGTQKTLALVSGGVGVVALGVAGVFGLKSAAKHSEAAETCVGSQCKEQRGVDAGEAAYAAGNVATVFTIVGVVGLGAGVALWFTAPRSNTPRIQARLGLGSARLEGAW